MSLILKPGLRILCAVDSTELIAIKAPTDPVELTIGGHPAVLSADDKTDDRPLDGHDAGVAMGKRYTDADGTIELLVTKPGSAVPAVDGTVLVLKEARPLPASD